MKREDLDMTTIVDQAFSRWLEANSLPGMMGALPPPKLEQLKRSMAAPIFHAIQHVIAGLEEEIISSFSTPDSFEGLTP